MRKRLNDGTTIEWTVENETSTGSATRFGWKWSSTFEKQGDRWFSCAGQSESGGEGERFARWCEMVEKEVSGELRG